MKKIVRLTESDVSRLVKLVIKEDAYDDDRKEIKMMKFVQKYVNYQLNGVTKVVSLNHPGSFFFKKRGQILFEIVIMDYKVIEMRIKHSLWMDIRQQFGFKNEERIGKLFLNWVIQNFDTVGVVPTEVWSMPPYGWNLMQYNDVS